MEDVTSPYYTFKYSIRSELTRKYYERRIRTFFDFIGFLNDSDIEKPTFTKFVTKTGQLKQEANDNAHNLTIIANQEDIAKLNIQETLELGLRLKETKIVKSI